MLPSWPCALLRRERAPSTRGTQTTWRGRKRQYILPALPPASRCLGSPATSSTVPADACRGLVVMGTYTGTTYSIAKEGCDGQRQALGSVDEEGARRERHHGLVLCHLAHS